MKCSLGISNFLEEIFSLSHSFAFFCFFFFFFFALITEVSFLISSCYPLELCIKWVYLSFSPLPLASSLLPLPLERERYMRQFNSVQSLSLVRLFAVPWIAACQSSLSITNSWTLLKLMSIESMMPSNHLILCCPLLLLPPIPPSIRVFSNESTLRMRWPKY